MKIVGILLAVAIIGVLTGLMLENIIEGDEAKLRSFLQGLKTNFVAFPFQYGELASVQNMISHATIDFEIIKTTVDPDGIPGTGDEHFLNQISECVFTSEESLDFETCLVCVISSHPPKDVVSCDCTRPDKFTVEYIGPDGVTIEIYKKQGDIGNAGKRLATFGPVVSGTDITIDSTAFLTGAKDKVEATTVYSITGGDLVNDEVIEIHTSCSRDLFVGDEHQDDEAKLIVVSGTLNGVQSVPDAVCRELSCKCTKSTIFTLRYDASAANQAILVDIEVYKKEGDIGNG